MEHFIAVLIFAVAAVGAWIVYRIFNRKNGPTVGPFGSVIAVSERKENGMDIIKYTVSLPVSKSGDVVKKVLSINRSTDADGKLKMVETVELAPDAETVDVEAGQGSQVDLALVAIDDAGNESSPPVTKTFIANDTVPPELTGEITVEATAERTETPAEDEGDGEETPPAGDEGDEAKTETDPAEGDEADPAKTPGK